MKIPIISAIVPLIFPLLLTGEWSGPDHRQTEKNKVIFEEVGQFNDDGMAVTVLVIGNYAYVCEFDNGLEILDISDPAHPNQRYETPG